MCLISKTNIPSKTSSSIECYKVLEVTKDELFSPYIGFRFELNKIYNSNEDTINLEKYTDNKYFVEGGFFHSCKNVNQAKRIISELHSILRRNKTSGAKVYKIFKAEIPIDTEFFEGQYEDIASKSLKIIEECFD